MCDKSGTFLKTFIKIYHNNPSLWNTKSRCYTNKILKQEAYEKLLKLYKSVDEKATINTVKKKINSIRTTFRKELNKVKLKNSGIHTYDVYVPSLWYYNSLLFLLDQEPGQEQLSGDFGNNDVEFFNCGNEESENSDSQECKVNVNEISSVPYSMSSEKNLIQRPSSSTSITTHTSLYSVDIPESKKPKRDDLLRIVEHQLQIKEDTFEITGKYIANKLRSLPKESAIFAEKLLMDVLFEAQMGTLNRESKIVI